MSETIIIATKIGTLTARQALSPAAQQLGVNEYIDSANVDYDRIGDDADRKIRAIPSRKDLTPSGRTDELNKIQNAAASAMREVFDKKKPALDVLVKRANDGLPTFPVTDRTDFISAFRAREIRDLLRPMSLNERRAFWTAAAKASQIEVIAAICDDPAVDLLSPNDDSDKLKADTLRFKYPQKFEAPDAAAEVVSLMKSNLQMALGSIGKGSDTLAARSAFDAT